ncbi:hypothetical protein HanHA300_Chr08g0289441 [Helianthus annuus]|nr:hypothetical protein HanHA300_Chr08g0289441 [Helianthus annuus]KAJ0547988.1 hypothetical protein HanIR_Chr08g0378371 [Helianthus annuus]KAJ0554435.1 hypothetical protein HanHA89_Chr08g0307741 [Helianthus annuus]
MMVITKMAAPPQTTTVVTVCLPAATVEKSRHRQTFDKAPFGSIQGSSRGSSLGSF